MPPTGGVRMPDLTPFLYLSMFLRPVQCRSRVSPRLGDLQIPASERFRGVGSENRGSSPAAAVMNPVSTQATLGLRLIISVRRLKFSHTGRGDIPYHIHSESLTPPCLVHPSIVFPLVSHTAHIHNLNVVALEGRAALSSRCMSSL